jgi:RNA polymerase II subunit A small phosphatase-like protein
MGSKSSTILSKTVLNYFNKTTKTNMNKALIILDLDETLIHATNDPVDDNWDFMVFKYKVYKRPGLDRFLNNLRKYFNVAVWSSASDDYVEKIVQEIFPKGYPLVFVWGRSKCTLQFDHQSIDDLGYSDYFNHLNYAKILKKAVKKGYADYKRTLIIDDTPRKLKYNYGNAIYAREFLGEQTDTELDLLFEYLQKIKDLENFRKIEKRNWRDEEKNS